MRFAMAVIEGYRLTSPYLAYFDLDRPGPKLHWIFCKPDVFSGHEQRQVGADRWEAIAAQFRFIADGTPKLTIWTIS
jgi:hypothetical protein